MAVDLQKIRALRKQKALSQSQMARFLGYASQTGYSYLETGKHEIRASQLVEIARVLGVPVEDLFSGQQNANLG